MRQSAIGAVDSLCRIELRSATQTDGRIFPRDVSRVELRADELRLPQRLIEIRGKGRRVDGVNGHGWLRLSNT